MVREGERDCAASFSISMHTSSVDCIDRLYSFPVAIFIKGDDEGGGDEERE